MQLVAYGAQDVYLTGNPTITFFKVVYKRHTNFAMEAVEIPLNSNPDFGKTSQVEITRNGDLVTKVYLVVRLAEINTGDSKAEFAWVRRIGLALLDTVEVQIGGARIDRQYGIWLNIWYELARHAGDGERGYLRMIGDVPELTEYNSEASPEYLLYIPLKFWFNRHAGLALPLIALQYHEVRMEFKFTRAEELVVRNCHFNKNYLKDVKMSNAFVLVDFIYLDSEERRRFAQVGHEYLIEQLQFTGVEAVTTNNIRARLNFNHPTKELVWAIQNGLFNSGHRFLCYTHKDDWSDPDFLKDCAKRLLSDSITTQPLNGDTTTDQYGTTSTTCTPSSSSSSSCFSNCTPCDPCAGEIETFAPGESGFTDNGNVFVDNQSDRNVLVNTHSLRIGKCYNLTDKIQADVFVGSKCDIKVTVTDTTLTPRDLSFPLDGSDVTDTRFNRDSDVMVYQPFNFGVLIDGSGNPVREALIQLNGHDRFDKREGSYFNYVQPDQHHTNTPADGINVYSFALHPEQHQPSGSANLSRIDNTQLNLWLSDPTQRRGLPALPYFRNDAGHELYIFDVNNNILRVMSGMGGLAYAN